MLARNRLVYLIFFVAFLINIHFWFLARHERASWANVPPVPSKSGVQMFTLGDKQLAFRTTGIMLQNLGDTGGRSTNFYFYNYDKLTKWFYLADYLDPKSHYVPLLAAFYFSATKNTEAIRPLTDYLAFVGIREGQQRWRWLAQAVFLARYRIEDLDLALELADHLANHPDQDRPAWTYQMPAFILNARGEKEAAYQLLLKLIQDRGERLHPSEVNFTYHYICRELLKGQDEIKAQLCAEH
jgi:hypothetical protein